ncbi:extracellular solute-binding protein [Cupriavidus pauculus]|uniref:extracellular solute-binding protein n=1 Tax=Cupriavidus pauculus TaxID=82633 RepID=UPI00203BC929|nr:extracellular solute-binding protein [Cupriavidus pauculus]MCM3609296.1 extracellular solute-binding protein [Cupriavidus pauculus]
MSIHAIVRSKRVIILFLVLLASMATLLPKRAAAAHGYAQFGDLKYPPGFTHFDYVTPGVRKGGSIKLSNPTGMTSFDTFSPFSAGNVAPGIDSLMFETLLQMSADEPASGYGLLAEDVTASADLRSVTFRLRPEARFSNGDPVRAVDVRYSFETLTSDKADPWYRELFKDLKAAEIVDPLTIRFTFRVPSAELPLVAGMVPVFSAKWKMGDLIKGGNFSPPISSGPYRIAAHNYGTSIAYVRDPEYWGRNLPVRAGTFNFDRIEYRLFANDQDRVAALHSGLIDLTFEYRTDYWAEGYNNKTLHGARLIKRAFPSGGIAPTQGFVFNTRRAPFRDVGVRKAIALAFDFESRYGTMYRRTTSWFPNSELAANANAREFSQTAPRLFEGTHEQAIAEARKLLAQAGWHLRNGVLRNDRSEPLSFEFMDTAATSNVLIKRFAEDLAKLGIDVRLRDVSVDARRQRLRDFDFDMANIVFANSEAPGSELRRTFGTAAASTRGFENYMGVASGEVDQLIDALVQAKTRKSQVELARALDSKLLNQWLIVPFGYLAQYRLAYREELAQPKVIPRNYTAASWVVTFWWSTGRNAAGSTI